MSEERARGRRADDHEPAIRLYVDSNLAADATVGLPAAQAHYVGTVMRLKAGRRVLLFNGCDGEWQARIDGIGKGWCSLTLESRTKAQTAEPDLWLLFAPLKRARLDFLVQHATELGAGTLWPVFTHHTAVSRINMHRLRANAIEAAEQSARLTVPVVHDSASLEQALAGWQPERHLYLCDESGAGRPMAEAFADDSGGRGIGPAAILVGPEGGFAASELDGLRKLPFVSAIGLGPRILRAETAAIAALACWQALAGDWQRT